MKKVTICFCVRDEKVLLALKKHKIGAGWLNGYGGKVEESDSTIVSSARRELQEEASIDAELSAFSQVAHIEFRFEGEPRFEGFIFFVSEWQGDPAESDEMGPPEWYPVDSLPEDKMWMGDRVWLPRLLRGETLNGWINYSADGGAVLEHEFIPAKFD